MPPVSLKHAPNKVTAKQDKFARILLETNDHVQAARQAYPNQVNPMAQADDNLSKPNVIARINQLRQEAVGLLDGNAELNLKALVAKTAEQSVANKLMVVSVDDVRSVPDQETRSKSIDRALRLYGILDRPTENHTMALSFNLAVSDEQLTRALDKMDKLADRLGFDKGQSGEVIDIAPES